MHVFMARIFSPKMWRGGAKIKWRSGANAMARKFYGGVVAQRFKRWRTSRWRELRKCGTRPALNSNMLCSTQQKIKGKRTSRKTDNKVKNKKVTKQI